MAHTCPDCGSACYCNGDIDDCVFDADGLSKAQLECRCCIDDPIFEDDHDDEYPFVEEPKDAAHD